MRSISTLSVALALVLALGCGRPATEVPRPASVSRPSAEDLARRVAAGDEADRLAAIDALRARREEAAPAVPALLAVVTDANESPKLRSAAKDALAWVGRRADEPLLERVRRKPFPTRETADLIAHRLKYKEFADEFFAAVRFAGLTGEEKGNLAEVLVAAGRPVPAAAVPTLKDTLASGKPADKVAAAHALLLSEHRAADPACLDCIAAATGDIVFADAAWAALAAYGGGLGKKHLDLLLQSDPRHPDAGRRAAVLARRVSADGAADVTAAARAGNDFAALLVAGWAAVTEVPLDRLSYLDALIGPNVGAAARKDRAASARVGSAFARALAGDPERTLDLLGDVTAEPDLLRKLAASDAVRDAVDAVILDAKAPARARAALVLFLPGVADGRADRSATVRVYVDNLVMLGEPDGYDVTFAVGRVESVLLRVLAVPQRLAFRSVMAANPGIAAFRGDSETRADSDVGWYARYVLAKMRRLPGRGRRLSVVSSVGVVTKPVPFGGLEIRVTGTKRLKGASDFSAEDKAKTIATAALAGMIDAELRDAPAASPSLPERRPARIDAGR